MSGPRGVLALVGATATGKSALALEVAERLGGEIISADAFTAYRGLDVATAKPTPEERARVPHHLIDLKDPREPFNAGEFATLARQAAREILSRGRLPILCGGTGFYVRSFFGGLFEGPSRDDGLRAALTSVGERRGAAFLKRAIDVLDPSSGANVLPGDGTRAARLLEILFVSGRRPSELFRDSPGPRWEEPAVKLWLTLPRAALQERIVRRFRSQMEEGLPREVRGLLDAGIPPDAPAFAAIGYRETVELLEGRTSVDAWRESIVIRTRQLAKRQETWFRKEPGFSQLDAEGRDLLASVIIRTKSLW